MWTLGIHVLHLQQLLPPPTLTSDPFNVHPLLPLSYCFPKGAVDRFWTGFKVVTSSSWRHRVRWLSTLVPAQSATSNGPVLRAKMLFVFQNVSGAPLERLLLGHTAATHSFCALMLRILVLEGKGPTSSLLTWLTASPQPAGCSIWTSAGGVSRNLNP